MASMFDGINWDDLIKQLIEKRITPYLDAHPFPKIERPTDWIEARQFPEGSFADAWPPLTLQNCPCTLLGLDEADTLRREETSPYDAGFLTACGIRP